MQISKRTGLGLALACLSMMTGPALAADKAPLHKIGLISTESLRVEPYATPLKIVPIDEAKK